MLQVSGYRDLELIYLGSKSTVYRAVREMDDCPVVLKAPSSELLPLGVIARYRYSYAITKGLKELGLCQTYDLIEVDKRPVLVMEDIQGLGLQEWTGLNTADLGYLLKLSIQLVDALAKLHEHSILHKDIKPSNIVFNPETGALQLIDFLLASQLLRESKDWTPPQQLEGTLHYIAPEQTGRINRQIDLRTDLYSLGVTLYEVFAGELPFQQADPMSLLHAHIALTAVPPHRVNPDIPEALSHIIMKLMEKRPENRYQSALGLKADLQHCLELFESTGQIHNFGLGRSDIFPTLQVSEKIYGREKEREQLLEALEQVKNGQTMGALIRGASGVGKTSLVRELYAPITENHGRLVQGKFDPLLHRPFSAILEAIQQLIRDVATLPSVVYHVWKERIQVAMGHVGRALVDEIPELVNLVGEQPELSPSTPQEAQHRFQRLLLRVLQVFASEEQPLVLFLDDLQWARSASLQFLFHAIASDELKHMLIIGTYRSNEVDDNHPLMIHSKSLRGDSSRLIEVELEPLPESAINRWVADSLFQAPNRTQLLTEEIFRKTKGNPIFVEHLLHALHNEKVLWVDRDSNQWKWDVTRVRTIGFSDDLGALMVHEFHGLPQGTQTILEIAACIGAEFDLLPLQSVTGQSLANLERQLQVAIHEGFVTSIDSSYKWTTLSAKDLDGEEEPRVLYRFAHDRLREAALHQQNPDKLKSTHFQLGSYFHQHLSSNESGTGSIFDIVNHWNLAVEMLTTPNQLELLLQLNIQAGNRAMEATAYPTAYDCFKAALSLVEQRKLKIERDTSVDLQTKLAESAQLSGWFEEAAKAEDKALALSETVMEKAALLHMRLKRYTSTFEVEGIAPTCLQLVSLFLNVSEEEGAIEHLTGVEASHVDELLKDRDISELVELPIANDPRIAIEIQSFTRIAYLFNWAPHLQMLSLCRAIRLSLEHGNTVESPFAYMNYALPLALMGQYDKALAFGDLALALNAKLNDIQSSRFAPLGQLYAPFMQHWRDPLTEVQEILHQSTAIAIEHGNYESACLCASNLLWVMLGQGVPFSDVILHAEQSLAMMQRLGQPFMVGTVRGVLYSLYTLAGLEDKLAALNAQGLDETSLIEQLLATFPPSAVEVYFRRLEQHLLLGMLEEALEDVQHVLPLLAPPFSLPTLPQFKYYQSILYAKLYQDATPDSQKEYKEVIKTNRAELKAWGERVPSNYLYMFHHVAAEWAAIEGDVFQVEYNLEEAIKLAQKHGSAVGEAVALERAADVLEAHGKSRAARSYRIDAYNAYVYCGAAAKTARLEVLYPNLRAHGSSRIKSTIERTLKLESTSTSTSEHVELDLRSILAASQAFSKEIALDKTLKALMKVVVQNAGAEKGLLLLPGNEGLRIEAKMDTPLSEPEVLQSLPLQADSLALTAVRFAVRTQQRVTEGQASLQGEFVSDPYIADNKVMSLLCMPLLKQRELVGLLYLENNITSHAFTDERCAVLDMLSSQIVVSITNARLYTNLEGKVEERTSELRHTNERLADTLFELESKHRELQDAQAQLIQSAKLVGLGTLVSGIAHELNNPISFSRQGAQNLERRAVELKEFLFQLVGENNDEVSGMFQEKFEPIFQNLTTVLDGNNRIAAIVSGLRLFSKHDEALFKKTDVSSDLMATMSLVKAQFKDKIDYSIDTPESVIMACWASQLNQAFMNILQNASQAIVSKQEVTEESLRGQVVVTVVEEDNSLTLAFKDNGCGMSEEVRARAFEPFFTTRPVGSGTGLGLSTVYGVVQKHQGTVSLESTPGVGTTVTIWLPLQG